MKTLKTIALVFSTVAIFTSCSDDDNKSTPVNEEELITTVKVTLTNGTNIITLTSKDLDGPDAPGATEITGGTLLANTTYTGKVELLNETETPVEIVSEEIEESAEEKLDHQFFFGALEGLLGTFTYEDEDGEGNPIGLSFTFRTGAASTGSLSVILRHLPNKSETGVSSGDITNAGGTTDAQAIFPITVQ
jgi:hypothetical protein